MFKKLGLVLLALLLVSAFVFVSCGDGNWDPARRQDDSGAGGGSGGGPTYPEFGLTYTGGSVNLDPKGNVEEDPPAVFYEIQWDAAWLFPGKKITEGDHFNMSGKVKFDQAVRKFGFVFVDTSEEADWFTELVGEEGIIEQALAADTDFDLDIDFVAIATSTANGPATNKLQIWVEVAGQVCPICTTGEAWACCDSEANGAWGGGWDAEWAAWCDCYGDSGTEIKSLGNVGKCNPCEACDLVPVVATFTDLTIN